MIVLHFWPFCIPDHFASVFVLSVAVIVRFAIESFCSVFSCLFRDLDCWFNKDHRSFFNFNMFYEYNRLFCRNVFFTLSAAHTHFSRLLRRAWGYGGYILDLIPHDPHGGLVRNWGYSAESYIVLHRDRHLLGMIKCIQSAHGETEVTFST